MGIAHMHQVPQQHLDTLVCTVDDEHHMIFDCAAFELIRYNVEGARALIASADGSVRTFMAGDMNTVRSFICGCIAELDRLRANIGD